MKYDGMCAGMWELFCGSFRRQLTATLRLPEHEAERVTAEAKARYRKILTDLPEFESADRFKMNIVSCAMLSAFLLSMEARPAVEDVADYYERAMMTPFMRWFCRKQGKAKFGAADVRGMQATAKLRAADRNPYSWTMEFLPYEDGSGYEARFSACGICALMRKLGLFEYVPAMCRLDYAMADAGGACVFVREHTLAGGGPYCDCGYKRKDRI